MKTIMNDDIAKVRSALYAAKFALEGGDPEGASREIIGALDTLKVATNTVATNTVAAHEVKIGKGGADGESRCGQDDCG
jgi:hypothetical protein